MSLREVDGVRGCGVQERYCKILCSSKRIFNKWWKSKLTASGSAVGAAITPWEAATARTKVAMLKRILSTCFSREFGNDRISELKRVLV